MDSITMWGYTIVGAMHVLHLWLIIDPRNSLTSEMNNNKKLNAHI